MKKILTILIIAAWAMTVRATDDFIVFQPSADAISLQGATVGLDNREHSCVQRAVASLQADMEKVTGVRPDVAQQPDILIGTVGCNKMIDQWVKRGELRNLKGKT